MRKMQNSHGLPLRIFYFAKTKAGFVRTTQPAQSKRNNERKENKRNKPTLKKMEQKKKSGPFQDGKTISYRMGYIPISLLFFIIRSTIILPRLEHRSSFLEALGNVGRTKRKGTTVWMEYSNVAADQKRA
ncbi:hypothetical protein AVEN_10060-1 [Araneus ventricosus]|uniref:Uncharacterized protein n=1 Tax=Araneus ventricosus TaxID=182803 RepID=A0A4Y2RW37_ARAVE|nr:hypothetical protein AVEN_168847-1 [Araneus ventricosus]GBN79284.1 hypothetical protein AVEN_10060-1 [Araneus ventricosus]